MLVARDQSGATTVAHSPVEPTRRDWLVAPAIAVLTTIACRADAARSLGPSRTIYIYDALPSLYDRSGGIAMAGHSFPDHLDAMQ